MWRFCLWPPSAVLVMYISIRMPIIVDIWVFVNMVSFMFGQVVYLPHRQVFLPHRQGIMGRCMKSFVLCFDFGLALIGL